MHKSANCKAALAYASFGWSVLLLQSGSKLPFPGSAGVRDKTTDPDKIADLWARNPSGNIGVTGPFVVDVDCKDGARGLENWLALIQRHGIPSGPVQSTPTGGRHYLFSADHRLKNTVSKIAAGIDTRSVGGYIVAAPSIIGGRSYRWLVSPRQSLPLVPQWIIDRLADRPVNLPTLNRSKHANYNPIGLIETVKAAPKGVRNARLFWAACRSAENGGAGLAEIAAAAIEAGLPAWEVRQTINSALRRGNVAGEAAQ